MKQNLKEIFEVRLTKLKKLKENNINPFHGKFKKTHQTIDIIENFEKLNDEKVIIAGRLISKRGHGKVFFANLQDFDGKIQLYIREDKTSKFIFDCFDHFIDIGDFVGVEGIVFKTQKGEISIRVKNITFLTKSLSPLPEKFHGLKDTDLRYRQRYLDLIMNEDVKKTFIIKSKIIKEIRNFLDKKGFIEVETPVLTSIAGGASARPFKTKHNALNSNLFLRISLELPLKRLLVGGFEKIFEIGRVFRNEGISIKHNPEFTLLELYQAYSDLRDMMNLTENIIINLIEKIKEKKELIYMDTKIDFKTPWEKITMIEAVKKYTKIDFNNFKEYKDALENCKDYLKNEKEIKNINSKGELLNYIFENYVEEKLINPTFVYNYPIEISPLAKKIEKNLNFADRFELFIFGREIVNAFSELNDPIDQKNRFLEQIVRKEKGDEEAQPYDGDFIKTLEYGMPPAGGLGIGIDRLVMLLTNSFSIRDVIIYPTMKEKKQ